ncbi:4421_t:CDS:1 [Funneliformis caledonium]|uniref:4421_t:CDS:1 n=1 Tax=Funneliformis caledonium TaxID=1117310 RepID=A0A9N8YL14_9GLOM|nr:4421_t:CDS:1 [Funneliformis caledonium]
MQSYGRIYTPYTRGNFKYYRPYGWKRIALKVLDNDWLGAKDRMNPFNSVDGEWINSYHGTAKGNVEPITKDGFDLSKGINFEFGIGIYSTPYIEIASGYATRFNYEGETYKVVFQNRVKPNTFNIENFRRYFVTSNDRDIRPYGICIQKCNASFSPLCCIN